MGEVSTPSQGQRNLHCGGAAGGTSGVWATTWPDRQARNLGSPRRAREPILHSVAWERSSL